MAGPGGLRILVCGGTGYTNRIAVWAALDRLHKGRGVAMIIHGAAPGADMLAQGWARGHGIEEEAYPASLASDDVAAPALRSQQMLRKSRPDGVVAFPGGHETAEMIDTARAAGVNVWEPVGTKRLEEGKRYDQR